MPGGHKRILSPFTGRKKLKPWNKAREKHTPEEKRQNLAEPGKGSYYNQEHDDRRRCILQKDISRHRRCSVRKGAL